MKNIYFTMCSLLLSLFLMFTSCSKEDIRYSKPGMAADTTKQAIEVVSAVSSLPAEKFKVVGYVTNWSGSINNIQFDKLTHINYAFLIPTATGGILPVENIPKLTELVKKAHSKNVKVLFSVGGWNYGDDSGFKSLSRNDAYRKAFAAKLLSVIKQYNLDGVDIDWEHPKVGETDIAFTLLMKQLNTTIRTQGKLVTAAVPAQNAPEVQNAVFGYVDFLNIMAYDSFIDDNNHSPLSLSVMALNYWKGRGLSTSKAVLGMPFYGRARIGWNFTSYVLYNELIGKGANPYSDAFGETRYNGITTVKNKTNLALNQAGGVMIWELAGDVTGEKSLLSAIYQAVLARR